MSTQTTTQKRKVARIVFDRPPLKKLNFFLWCAAGLVLGLLVALLLHWLMFGLGDANTGTFLDIYSPYSHEIGRRSPSREWYQFYPVLGLCGLIAGVCLGFGWKRPVTARIEMVEQPSMARRRSSSTAMVRVDYGRRW